MDLLVRLYDLPDTDVFPALTQKGIRIIRAMTPNKHQVLKFIKETFSAEWASECDAAFARQPVSCYIALKDHEILGFACTEATQKGFFGPTGVAEEFRNMGIGRALLYAAMRGMYESGYAYAIIGGVAEALPFYQRCLSVMKIECSDPGIYRDLISYGET